MTAIIAGVCRPVYVHAMKTMMLSLAAAALLVPVAVNAGERLTANMVVSINTSARTASGQMSATRATSDRTALLGCSVGALGTGSYVICEAMDAKGTYLSCESSVPAFVQAASAINSDSYIYYAVDASGSCTQLVVNTGSAYAPK